MKSKKPHVATSKMPMPPAKGKGKAMAEHKSMGKMHKGKFHKEVPI